MKALVFSISLWVMSSSATVIAQQAVPFAGDRVVTVMTRNVYAGVDAEIAALADLAKGAAGTANVLPLMKEALRLRATVGEVCHTLRGVWGVYRPVERF